MIVLSVIIAVLFLIVVYLYLEINKIKKEALTIQEAPNGDITIKYKNKIIYNAIPGIK